MEAAQPDLSVLRIEKRETLSLSVISIIFIKIEVWQPAQWPEQGGSNKNGFGAKKEEDKKRVRWCTGHEKMPRSLLHSWLQVRRAAIPSDSDLTSIAFSTLALSISAFYLRTKPESSIARSPMPCW